MVNQSAVGIRNTPRTPPLSGTPGTPGGGGAPGYGGQEAYFAELLAHPLERLAKEPELLVDDQKQLLRQVQVGGLQSFNPAVFNFHSPCLAHANGEMSYAAAAPRV